MSHFAKINGSNIVTEIIVSEQDFINSGAVGDSFLWIQTSYNNNFRKNFAAVGDTYDKARDAFITVKPFASWVLDEATCQWKAPTDCPGDLSDYYWKEGTLSWAQEE